MPNRTCTVLIPGLRIAQAGIGNMHIPQLHAPVARVSQKMRAQGGRRSEVYAVGPGRNIVVGKQRAAAEFKIRDDSSASGKVPFQIQRIETGSERGVGRLEHQEQRHRIQRVFESSFKKSGPVGTGQDPSVTQPGVPHPGIRSAARDRVAAAGPKLYLVAAVLDSGLAQADSEAQNSKMSPNECSSCSSPRYRKLSSQNNSVSSVWRGRPRPRACTSNKLELVEPLGRSQHFLH